MRDAASNPRHYETNRACCCIASSRSDAAPSSVQHLDDGEHVAVETRALAEVGRAIRAGAIDHALVITAFAHLALELGELRRRRSRA